MTYIACETFTNIIIRAIICMDFSKSYLTCVLRKSFWGGIKASSRVILKSLASALEKTNLPNILQYCFPMQDKIPVWALVYIFTAQYYEGIYLRDKSWWIHYNISLVWIEIRNDNSVISCINSICTATNIRFN